MHLGIDLPRLSVFILTVWLLSPPGFKTDMDDEIVSV